MSSRRNRRELERLLNKSKKTSYFDLLYKIKYELSEYQANLILNKITNKQNLLGIPFPKDYKDLRKSGNTYNIEKFEKEIIWYTKEIINNSELINKFLDYKNIFESSILKGDYDKSHEILDKIENEISVSDWSIAGKLLLSEFSGGFTKNKSVLGEIIDNSEINSFTELFARFYSNRAEKQLSFSKYHQDILNLTANLKPQIKEYILFKLNFFSYNGYSYFGSILNFENSASLSDKYEILINILIIILSTEKVNFELLTIIKDQIKLLSDLIQDYRLKNILLLIDDDYNLDINNSNQNILNVLNLYTSGKYEEVISLLNSGKFEWSNIFPLYTILSKSYAYVGEDFQNPFPDGTLANTTLEATNSILLKDSNFQSSVVTINKNISTIGLNHFTFCLNDFLNSNSQSDSYMRMINSNLSSLLSSNYFNPLLLTNIENLNRINDILISENSTVNLLLFNTERVEKSFGENNIEEFRKNKYKLKYFIENKNYKDASTYLEYFDSLPYDDSRNKLAFNIIPIINFKTDYYLHCQKYSTALNEIVQANLINSNYSYNIHAEKILTLCFEEESLKSDISSPIIIHQYYPQHLNKNSIWISLDNYLSANNLNYPKDIIKITEQIDEKLIYLLKNVCIQDIYDSSFWFENQDSLDAERIEICTILSNIDKENFENYINEISEIDRNILIRKGVKQIDESKIYVDINGLKKSLYKDLNENLQRSTNLQSLSIDQITKLDLKENKVLMIFYDQDNNNDDQTDSNIKITGYSRFKIFKEMFLKLRDNFIANNEYGLDTYLSMRIRHGTLLGEFRSNFEKYYLVTKKENESKYKENQYWKSLTENDEKLRNKFNSVLSDFSERIDSTSNSLKNNKIQIKTENKISDGFFDFSYSETELHRLFQDKFAAIKTTELFIDETLEELWSKTEKNLKVIRDYISIQLKEEITGYISELNNNVDELISKKDNPLYSEFIRNLTNCKTDIRNELDKIASWFRKTNNKSINDFNIQLPIDSTLITFRRIYKDFSSLTVTTKNNCSKKFEGEFFQHFCYIFQNLIHNIIEHSGLLSYELNIIIEINELENNLIISVQNNLSESLDIDNINNKIQNIITALNKEKNSDRIRNESGTGYIKINKTLYHDLRRNYFEIIIHPVDENRVFKCEIIMDSNNLYKVINENTFN